MHIMCVRGVYVTDPAHNIIFGGNCPYVQVYALRICEGICAGICIQFQSFLKIFQWFFKVPGVPEGWKYYVFIVFSRFLKWKH